MVESEISTILCTGELSFLCVQGLTTNKHNFSHLCCITLPSLLLHLFLSSQTVRILPSKFN